MVNYHIASIEQKILPLRQQLLQHPLYAELHSLENIRHFMEGHAYAVWDFMVLLKALQRRLTSVEQAWVPSENRSARRLINEIVLAEESDLNLQGQPASHYEMYLDAMLQCGADTAGITQVIDKLREGYSHRDLLRYNLCGLPAPVRRFLQSSYRVCRNCRRFHLWARRPYPRPLW